MIISKGFKPLGEAKIMSSGSNLIKCKTCGRFATDINDEFKPIYPKDGGEKYWLCTDCYRVKNIFEDDIRSKNLHMVITGNGIYTRGGLYNYDTV
jgi:hypothetical protein